MEMYEILSVATGLLCECVCVYVFVCTCVCSRMYLCMCVLVFKWRYVCLWEMDACVCVSSCADRIVVAVGGGGANIDNLFIA